jgi:hypothetical protein
MERVLESRRTKCSSAFELSKVRIFGDLKRTRVAEKEYCKLCPDSWSAPGTVARRSRAPAPHCARSRSATPTRATRDHPPQSPVFQSPACTRVARRLFSFFFGVLGLCVVGA